MPIYEFRCAQCGTTFDERMSIDEHGQRRPPCPKCHTEARVEPQLSTFHAVTSRKT
jgi:putative FmdB family regulatory protein